MITPALMVTLPSGVAQPVLNAEEAAYLSERVARYHADNALVNISDVQDLDRMLVMELMCQRWGHWLGQQKDYDGKPFDDTALRRDLDRFSQELRQLKRTLGIDKVAREKEKGAGSLPHYVAALGERAKAFGYMRNAQAAKAVEGAMELLGLVTLHKNCTDAERAELRATAADIVEWVDTVFRPEMEEIDRKFRQDGPAAQKTWIRSQ